MEAPLHDMHMLFTQIGLPADPLSIRDFIAKHSPLPAEVQLPDAPFWTAAQAGFLREGLLGDADWSNVIDKLNRDLRAPT